MIKLTGPEFLEAVDRKGSLQLPLIRPIRFGYQAQWLVMIGGQPYITAWIDVTDDGWQLKWGVICYPAKQVTKTVHEWVMA